MCFEKFESSLKNRLSLSWIGFAITFIILIIFACFNFSLLSNRIVATLAAIFLIFITGHIFAYSAKIAITIIVSILLILIGFIFYNPATNTIPIKFLSVSDYCKLQFYEHFQNEMNGICVLCEQKSLDYKFLKIFPDNWPINMNQKKILEKIRKDSNLLNLVCASDFPSLLCQLDKIKSQELKKIDSIIQNESKDNIEKIKEKITKILLLDQAILLASAQTINSCQCENRNQTCDPCKKNNKLQIEFTKKTSIDESLSSDAPGGNPSDE